MKQLIQAAHQQQQEISGDLNTSRTTKADYEKQFKSWERGFLLKIIFKKAFARRKENFETEAAKVAELEEQLKLSAISTQIDLAGEQGERYYRLRDEFAALCDCAAIWDVKTHQATDKFHERTAADSRVGRERVRFSLGSCELIEWDQQVPHLQNCKGGEMFLYPGFILYRAARQAFSLIEYHDINGEAKSLKFHEADPVPADSLVIGATWEKANKDGNRDRRFSNNRQIPIVQYGELTLKSDNGLWEEFEFSNVSKLLNWLNALNAFTASFASVNHA